jgi:hypothetical protein
MQAQIVSPQIEHPPVTEDAIDRNACCQTWIHYDSPSAAAIAGHFEDLLHLRTSFLELFNTTELLQTWGNKKRLS